MQPAIRLAILDDHQSIIDGYLYRLSRAADMEVVAMLAAGEDLEKPWKTRQSMFCCSTLTSR